MNRLSNYKSMWSLVQVCTKTNQLQKIATFCDRRSIEKMKADLEKKFPNQLAKYQIMEQPVYSPYTICEGCPKRGL